MKLNEAARKEREEAARKEREEREDNIIADKDFIAWTARYLSARNVTLPGEKGRIPIRLTSCVEFVEVEEDVMWNYTYEDASGTIEGTVKHKDLLSANKFMKKWSQDWKLSNLLGNHVEHTSSQEYHAETARSTRTRLNEAQFQVREDQRHVYGDENGPNWTNFLKKSAKERKKGFEGEYDGGWKTIPHTEIHKVDDDDDDDDDDDESDEDKDIKHPHNAKEKPEKIVGSFDEESRTNPEILKLQGMFASKADLHGLSMEEVQARVQLAMNEDCSAADHGINGFVLPGNMMNKYPELQPENVQAQLRDIPNKKEKIKYVRWLILRTIFFIMLPKEFLMKIALQTNLQVELENRRFEQAQRTVVVLFQQTGSRTLL
jgi:hypothetical protein